MFTSDLYAHRPTLAKIPVVARSRTPPVIALVPNILLVKVITHSNWIWCHRSYQSDVVFTGPDHGMNTLSFGWPRSNATEIIDLLGITSTHSLYLHTHSMTIILIAACGRRDDFCSMTQSHATIIHV